MIRRYLPCDYSAVIDMMGSFYAGSAVLHSVPSSNFCNTIAQVVANSPYVDILVVVEGECIVGYMQLSLTYSNEAGGQVVWIEELYIMPAYQGRGLGSSAVQYVLQQYPQAARVRLEVCGSNSGAVALYKRMGFAQLDYNQYVLDR